MTQFSGKRLAHLVCRHTNKTKFAGDGNFHINKRVSNTDPDDIALVKERGFHPLHSDWEAYLKELKPAGNKKVGAGRFLIYPLLIMRTESPVQQP